MVFSEVGAELRKQTRDGEVAGEPQEKGARSSRSLPVKSPGNMPEVSVLSEQKKKKKKKNQLCHSAGLWKTSLPPTDTYAQNQNTHFAHRASRFNEHNTFTGIVPLENKWGIVYFSGLHFLFSPAAPKSPKCSEQEDVRWRENKEQGGKIESKSITHETLHKTVISWNILRK